jgi:hypothetical protein
MFVQVEPLPEKSVHENIQFLADRNNLPLHRNPLCFSERGHIHHGHLRLPQ